MGRGPEVSSHPSSLGVPTRSPLKVKVMPQVTAKAEIRRRVGMGIAQLTWGRGCRGVAFANQHGGVELAGLIGMLYSSPSDQLDVDTELAQILDVLASAWYLARYSSRRISTVFWSKIWLGEALRLADDLAPVSLQRQVCSEVRPRSGRRGR